MRFNVLSNLRHWKKDLFTHTQYRLAFQYSMIMMIFLTLFIAIVYFLVNTFISFDQERQLQTIADQQTKTIVDSLRDGKLSQIELETLNSMQESNNQSFYFMVNAKGQPLFGESFIPRFETDILLQLQGWVPQFGEIRYETMTLPHPPRRGLHASPREKRQIDLMMTGRSIYVGEQLAGIYYTGKDISFIHELMQRLLLILILLGTFFLGIALLLSHFMSKRAMIPIRLSFQRQREFVADASHELRTPLSILNSSIDVLEMEDGESLSDYSQKILFNMKDEVRRMTKLVSDLLTLARTDSGAAQLKRESFDFTPSVEQLVRSTQTLAHSKNISLSLHAPASLFVYADHERLKQLLYILLDNAIKYTPNGGEVNLTLSVDLTDKTRSLCIAVQDTGIGISLDEQKRIFDRFFRADKNRSRQMGGTGLGLAIAKWIVESHQGTIQVSSLPSEGSTFTVKLPIIYSPT